MQTHFWLRCLFVGLLSAALLSVGCGKEDSGDKTDAGQDVGEDVGDWTDDVRDDPNEDVVADTGDSTPLPPPVCRPGEQGCSCLEGQQCGSNSAGEALICLEGICESSTCVTGQIGCVCRQGTNCEGSGECRDGFCFPANCAPGEEHCECAGGSCQAGLFCQNGTICVDGSGREGGACLPNGTCHRSNRCETALNVCVYCDPGSAGCSCTDAGTCSGGLACAAGRCVATSELPPREPRCYSPCRQDLVTADGNLRFCRADGLVDGCLANQECVQGSCVEPGLQPPTCSSDMECPFFQTCLQGGCYSNCEVDADCPTGRGCSQMVCRVPCQSGTACPTGEACEAPDGENGYCVPVSAARPQATMPPSAGFDLSTNSLRFSNIAVTQSIELTGDPVRRQDLTVRKLRHSVYFADGRVEHVTAPVDAVTGDYVTCDAARGECPLFWLDLSAGASPVRTPTLGIELVADCAPGTATPCPTLTVGNAAGSPGVRWEGVLELSTRDAHTRVHLSYVERPEGQWTGSMYYFGSFNDARVDEWLDGRTEASELPNGLIAQWDAFRRNRLNDGWQEFLAILMATRTESWRYENVRNKCRQIGAQACYPYTNQFGVRTYVQDLQSAPIPTGVVELPIAINLEQSGPNPAHLTGRIVTDRALHYPGNPAVSLRFAANPASSASCDPRLTRECVIFLDEFAATIQVGGRYESFDGMCSPGFEAYDLPWLVPGFVDGARYDESRRQHYRRHCMDSELPYDTTPATGNPLLVALNENLALANPVPDGLPRTRHLELLDGALVNQSELIVLFRERFESFIPGQPDVAAYGYMLLARTPADLEPADFEGAEPPPSQVKTPQAQGGAVCDDDLLRRIVGSTDPIGLNASQTNALVSTLIQGTATDGTQAFSLLNPATVHYFCDKTGLFDAGPEGDVPCPAGSRVEFFHGASLTAAQVRHHACQADGSCQTTLNRWLFNGTVITPLHRCLDINAVNCSANRLDLREGKSFYAPTSGNRDFLLPIKPLIASAFRYKVQFQSDEGGSIGFAPDICVPNSDEKPYCYDPAQIAEIRERIDCLLEVYSEPVLFSRLSPTNAALLTGFLGQSFSRFDGYDGFERLYAELMIMLGDEALTRAFASRFDLAAANTAAFEGSKFEPRGIDLSGIAGAQMYNLYQAVQYYQLALDRLYLLGPDFAAALLRGAIESDANFISQETVTLYLERLVRGATQKAVAFGEIAHQYQALNRPDLARTVIERAYAATYLESALMTNLMQSIVARAGASIRDQIRLEIERTQRSLRAALRDMRAVHQAIFDDLTYFGFAPDYIPFPAVDPGSGRASNAFEAMRSIAEQKVSLAKQREQGALSSNLQFRVDRATFQSELIRVRNTYENQLTSICGSFTGRDGRVYPATRKYAHLNDVATLVGDPCGVMGNGGIHQARGQLQDSVMSLEAILLRHGNVEQEILNEQERVARQCGLIGEIADYKFKVQGKIISMQEQLGRKRALMNMIQGHTQTTISALQAAICDPVTGAAECAIGAANAAMMLSTGITTTQLNYDREIEIIAAQTRMQDMERSAGRWEMNRQCDFAQIESEKLIKSLMMQLEEVELEALRGDYQSKLAASRVQELINEAQRWEAQQVEAEQMLINVEAARNDPNIRIYRNDAVINADIAFYDALRAVYRLTRVFEYYTSQTYVDREDLFLIRMVTAGQKNLENYLIELDNAYFDFEEQFGLPSQRVMVLSLRDDILQIPYYDEQGRALSQGQRIDRMRRRLNDVTLLDSRGYLILPFSTQLEELSPLTRNHKINYVEADIVGSNVGDTLGRLYLRARGTGIVQNVEGDRDFYVFPSRTAVINPFFNGNRVYDPQIYRSFRLKDRPLVNTSWELILNQRDEAVNRDIDLGSLSDIRLLFFYTDFTAF
jgi:hypothetical protein